MSPIYYGRVSTAEQSSTIQYEDATARGVNAKHIHIDEGVSGYHVAPADRPEWKRVMDKLSDGGVLYVRWLDRISRRYDELHRVMRQLMDMGVKVVCTMNDMEFDGTTTDPIKKSNRDSIFAFVAAQCEADYLNRRQVQAQGIVVAKAEGKYKGRRMAISPEVVRRWRIENGASIEATAKNFDISMATVKRYCGRKESADQCGSIQS